MGSAAGAAGNRSAYAREASQWSGESVPEERGGVEFRDGGGYRPGDASDGAVPQFLVEADEAFDDQSGEARLAAPPVLGESPASYRDF